MFISYVLMFFLATAGETVQSDAVPAEYPNTTSVENASKFCANTKQATKNFRENMQGFDRVAWNKEMANFEKDCQRGFLGGFEQSGLILSKKITQSKVDEELTKVENFCGNEMKKQKATSFGPLHYNIGCIMGGQMRIYQRIQIGSK